MCPFPLFLSYSFLISSLVCLFFSHQLLIAFPASPSHATSLSLYPTLSKQRLADGFPITAGTEGLGWLPHVNVWAPALNISSTESKRQSVKMTQREKIYPLKAICFNDSNLPPLFIHLHHSIHVLWGYVYRLTSATPSCSWVDNSQVDTLPTVCGRQRGGGGVGFCSLYVFNDLLVLPRINLEISPLHYVITSLNVI